MNRQTKRMMARQGQSPEGGPAPAADRRQQVARQRTSVKRDRTSPATFLREVRGELRRVAWPTRDEVVNYSGIVLVTLVVLIALIFVLDYAFAKTVLFLFQGPK